MLNFFQINPGKLSQVECAICLVKGNKVQVLPCHYIFCLHKVYEWLQHKNLVKFYCISTQAQFNIINAISAMSVKQM